jgi:hypothetical protein
MQLAETYTIEAAVALVLIAIAYKLYEMHCHLQLDDEDRENAPISKLEF